MSNLSDTDGSGRLAIFTVPSCFSETAQGHFGTGAEVSWCRSVRTVPRHFWSVIFKSGIFQSRIFHNRYLLRHFPVLNLPFLHFQSSPTQPASAIVACEYTTLYHITKTKTTFSRIVNMLLHNGQMIKYGYLTSFMVQLNSPHKKLRNSLNRPKQRAHSNFRSTPSSLKFPSYSVY